MKINLHHSAYSQHFENVILSKKRYVIAYGGRGSSKTETFYIKYLLELFKPYPFRLLYVNKEASGIRDNQYAGFKRVAKRIGLFDHLKFYEGDYRIVNLSNGNALIPKGLDNAEKTKGSDDITAIWWDEVTKGSLNDYLTLNKLLRTSNCDYLQFAISFNPVDLNHWTRKEFFSVADPYVLAENYQGRTLINHSIYLDNDFINKNEYLETLLKGKSKNANVEIVDVKGMWGLTDVSNPFIFMAHHMEINSNEYKLNTQCELHLSFDYNHSPTTCSISQPRRDLKQYITFDLISADINTSQGNSPLQSVCNIINQKYISVSKHLWKVTGDSSGLMQQANQIKGYNYFVEIKNKLRLNESQIIVKHNIDHVLSRSIINETMAVFMKHLVITGDTLLLQDEIKNSYADEKGTLNEWKKKAGGHYLDNYRYLVHSLLLKISNKEYKKDIYRSFNEITGKKI